MRAWVVTKTFNAVLVCEPHAPHVRVLRGAPVRTGVALAGGVVVPRPDADRCRHSEPEQVTVFFGLAGPKAVLAIISGKLAARLANRAGFA